MADSSLVVSSGSGTNIHTSDRSYSGTTKKDQYVLPAEYDLASYIVAPTVSISIATAADHIIQIMAGASLNVRIRCIHVEVAASATTAGLTPIEIWRLSTAGTGGTAYTPRPLDSADAASGATAMTLPTAKGTETSLVGRRILTVRSAVSTLGGAEDVVEWVYEAPRQKPLLIPAGVTSGIAVKSSTATAAATVAVEVYFVETAFI